jgi:hypothetical protein
MFAIVSALLSYPLPWLRPKHHLALEVLALRHQILVTQRQTPRPKLRQSDRYLWVMLRKVWLRWKTPLMIFQPETVIGWQRAGFRRFWRWKSRRRPGKPQRFLIRCVDVSGGQIGGLVPSAGYIPGCAEPFYGTMAGP